MVFELDTKDMERHAVELRLYIEKAKRRFSKAQMIDMFEKIVKNQLAQTEGSDAPNTIQIDYISEEDVRRLSNFLDSLVDKCLRSEQHEMLQGALRKSLGDSRRRSIIDNQGQQIEPVCYFCAGDNQQATNSLPAFGVNNLYEAINTYVSNQHQQLEASKPPEADTSFVLAGRHHSPGLDPITIPLMNGHGAANLPTPPASNGAPTPQPATGVGAGSESSDDSDQGSSHTPPYPPPPSPPVAGTSNASQAHKRPRLDIVERPTPVLAKDDLEDSMSEWFRDPKSLARSSTPLSDSDSDTEEDKVNSKPAPFTGSKVNVSAVRAPTELGKPPKEQKSNESQVKINTETSTMASASQLSINSSSGRRQAPVMKRRPKRSQTQASSQDCSRYKQTNNSQPLNLNGRPDDGSGQAACSTFYFGLEAAAVSSSMSQPARPRQSEPPHQPKQPQPSPIVKCRPKSSKKSSIQPPAGNL